MKITFDQTVIDLTPKDTGYLVRLDDKTVEVKILRAEDGKLKLVVGDQRLIAYVSSDNAKRWVTVNGQTVVMTKAQGGAKRKSSGHDHASDLVAPMPGLVRSVNVVEGDTVKKGQTLLIVEAMKMEIRIQAKGDGVVKKIFVKQGQTVEREQALVEIE